MRTALRIQFAASCLALAVLTGCAGGSGPVAPSGGDGATITGTVIRTAGTPLGLRVGVLGTDLSAVVESSGSFQIARVPTGSVQLNFKDTTVNATTQLSNVAQDEFIEIQVQVSGTSATILNETRSSGKVSLCHRTDSGEYQLIDVSVNAEAAHRAHGDAKVGEPVPGTQRQVFDASCRPVGPAVKIKKSTNGEDADNAPGPSILVGSAVTWSYVVTNTGTIGLTGLVVVDDRGVSVKCISQTILPAGQTMTCSGSGIATLGQVQQRREGDSELSVRFGRRLRSQPLPGRHFNAAVVGRNDDLPHPAGQLQRAPHDHHRRQCLAGSPRSLRPGDVRLPRGVQIACGLID